MFGLAQAPELDRPGLTWFNVERPLCLADLRGRLVILDFWTGCCVNCLHVLPTLRRIENAFPDSVAVIGVHSPKFPAERDPSTLYHTLARCDIRHPVVHDPELILWGLYGVCGWPTLVFIGPDGRVLGDLPGEPATDKLLAGIGEMVRHWRGISGPPPPLPLLPMPCAGGRLRFPGKIKPLRLADGTKRWVIADTGHHQIVVFGDNGSEIGRFGSGRPGFVDLEPESSAFRNPQGLVCDDRFIYVADTGNHAIRRIDVAAGMVTTLAGTGERGSALADPVPGRDAVLASVWDLALAGNRLFFANAGTHQLGELDLTTGIVRPLAGCGAEDITDGSALEARLAQPSGLALDRTGETLYFADSETSAVRALRLAGTARVETLVGAGLFDFGDRDGRFEQARMQHCLGLDWWDERLVVADTYNGRIRVLDLKDRKVRKLGERHFTWADGECLTGGEPAGVVADGPDRLLVADTNNHRVVELRVKEQSARTWAR